MTPALTRVVLPHGLWRRDVLHREATLRPVTGADEMLALDTDSGSSMAARVSSLLGCCVERIGDIEDEPVAESVRHLTIGDREALLLHIRALTFGERIDCVLTCPSCHTRLASDLHVRDLLVTPPADALEWHTTEVRDGDAGTYHVTFQLPTGADQERVASEASRSPDAAAVLLVALCIRELRRDAGANLPIDSDLPPCVVTHLDDLLQHLDPQAELRLELPCAVCAAEFSTVFDTASFLLREIESHGSGIYREVHAIARHYHWSEADILAMTPAKRGRYLDLIAESDGAGALG